MDVLNDMKESLKLSSYDTETYTTMAEEYILYNYNSTRRWTNIEIMENNQKRFNRLFRIRLMNEWKKQMKDWIYLLTDVK